VESIAELPNIKTSPVIGPLLILSIGVRMSSRWSSTFTGIVPSTEIAGRGAGFQGSAAYVSLTVLGVGSVADLAQATRCFYLQSLRKHSPCIVVSTGVGGNLESLPSEMPSKHRYPNS
jgi:hypothetical protein